MVWDGPELDGGSGDNASPHLYLGRGECLAGAWAVASADVEV